MTFYDVAGALRILPLLWLGWLALHYQRRDREHRLLGLGFAVSPLTDLTVKLLPVMAPLANLYPLVQALAVALVVLDETEARQFAGILTLAGGLSVALTEGSDLLLYTVASLSVCLIVWRSTLPTLLQASLYAFFGGSWLALVNSFWNPYPWAGFVFHATTLAGCALFCVAASRAPQRHLQLVRRAA